MVKMGIGEFFMYIWLKPQFKREFFHIPSQHFFVGKSRITPFPKARAKAVAPQQPLIPPCWLCGSIPSLTLLLHLYRTVPQVGWKS